MEKIKEHCSCCRNFCPIEDLQCRKGKEKLAERLKKEVAERKTDASSK
ncbi:hypothetical protein [Clostridium sp. AM58-1XD]|nr:hypothetical protein [Clostridium sp. AM58-1XD]